MFYRLLRQKNFDVKGAMFVLLIYVSAAISPYPANASEKIDDATSTLDAVGKVIQGRASAFDMGLRGDYWNRNPNPPKEVLSAWPVALLSKSDLCIAVRNVPELYRRAEEYGVCTGGVAKSSPTTYRSSGGRSWFAGSKLTPGLVGWKAQIYKDPYDWEFNDQTPDRRRNLGDEANP